MIKFIKYSKNYIILTISFLILFFFGFIFYHNIYINFINNISFLEFSIFFIVLKVMLCIVIPVIFLTLYFLYKYRASNLMVSYQPNWSHSFFLELFIWFIPLLIVLFLANLSWKSTHALEPSKIISAHNSTPITIQVVALDWQWLFIYPKYQIATINECCIPINTPIRFLITSNTVMNSFFIPKLGSQIYAMAGMKTTLNLISNKINSYKGFSSNYSGAGFSDMKFQVKSVKNIFDFHNWIQKIRIMHNDLILKNKFLKISYPKHIPSVQYFSRVNVFLFKKIIQSFKQI